MLTPSLRMVENSDNGYKIPSLMFFKNDGDHFYS